MLDNFGCNIWFARKKGKEEKEKTEKAKKKISQSALRWNLLEKAREFWRERWKINGINLGNGDVRSSIVIASL